MSVWEEAKALRDELAKRRQAEVEHAIRESQMNSAKAIEWRHRVLEAGRLGYIDPAPETKKDPATPKGSG